MRQRSNTSHCPESSDCASLRGFANLDDRVLGQRRRVSGSFAKCARSSSRIELQPVLAISRRDLRVESANEEVHLVAASQDFACFTEVAESDTRRS